jgi:hypothetical protein
MVIEDPHAFMLFRGVSREGVDVFKWIDWHGDLVTNACFMNDSRSSSVILSPTFHTGFFNELDRGFFDVDLLVSFPNGGVIVDIVGREDGKGIFGKLVVGEDGFGHG